MASKDFRAERLRTSAIIASGSDTTSKPSILIYSASDATNFTGGVPASMLTSVGTDVFMFVSGTIVDGTHTTERTNVTLFGGDIVVSGTIFGEKIVQEVEVSTTSDLHMSGGLILNDQTVSRTINAVASDGALYVTTGSLIFRSTTDNVTYSEAILTSVSGGLGIITDVVGNRTELRTDDAVVAHLTGSQFNGNVGITGSLEVEGDLSLVADSRLRLNNPGENDQYIYGNNSTVYIDGDNFINLAADNNINLNAGVSNINLVNIGSNKTEFNTGRQPYNFEINTDNFYATLFVDGADETVILGHESFDSSPAASEVSGYGADVKIMLSGSIGVKDTSTRGVVLVPGDIVVSGSYFNGTGENIAKTAENGIGDQSGGLYLDINELTGSLTNSTIAQGDLLAVSDIDATNNETKKITKANFVSSMIGTGIESAGDGTLNTDDGIVAHLTGAQFSGNVGITGSLGVNDDVSLSVGKNLYFNGMDGDISIRATDTNTLRIDGDDVVDIFVDSEFAVFAGAPSNGLQMFVGRTEFNINRTDVDFEVNTENRYATLFVDGADETIILGHEGFNSTPDASQAEGYGADVKIMLSGTIGAKDTTMRGVVLVPGDLVVSGSVFNGTGENIAKTAGNGIQDQNGSLALNIHDLTGSHNQNTIASGDFLAVADIDAADDETKKITVANFATSLAGVGLESAVAGKLNTDDGIVAHLTGSQFSGNVGVTGSFGVEGDASLAQGSKLYFDGMNGDINIYASSLPYRLNIDGDDSVFIAANSNIQLDVVNNTMVLTSDTVEINAIRADVDFEVNTDDYYATLFVDGNDNTIILGHEGFDSTPSASEVDGYGADVKIMLSGSAGSKDTSTRGVVLVPGDMVVSGSLVDGNGSNIKLSSYNENGSFANPPNASGTDAIAIGNNAVASGNNSIAMGTSTTNNTDATGLHSTAIGGDDATASGDYSIALGGYGNTASGDYSAVIGRVSTASGENSIAIGNSLSVSENNTIAIGNNTNSAKIAMSGSVEVFSDLVAGNIKNLANTSTNLNFSTDQIDLNVANTSKVKIDNNQVLILSGGNAIENDESAGSDINFYVSGSVSSRGTASRGTSLFGGDVHASGSISTSNELVFDDTNIKIYKVSNSLRFDDGENTPKTLSELAATGATNEFFTGVHGSDASTAKVKTTGSVAFAGDLDSFVDGLDAYGVGTDVFVYFSGSQGSRGTDTRGVTLFGGDMAVSGSATYLGDTNFTDVIASNNVVASGSFKAAGDLIINSNEDKIFKFDSANPYTLIADSTIIDSISAQSNLHIEKDTNVQAATSNVYSDFGLVMRNDSVQTNAFAGIAFDVSTETDTDSIGAAIRVERDTSASTTPGNHDANITFATNDAGDGGLTERMRITHDGKIGIGITDPLESLHISGDLRIDGDDIKDSGGNIAISFNGSGKIDNNVDFTGAIDFESTVNVSQYIQHLSDTDTRLNFQDDLIAVEAGGVAFVKFEETTQNQTVFNEGGNDIDFRVESSEGITGDDFGIFMESSTGKVGLSLNGAGSFVTDARLSVKGYAGFVDPNGSSTVAMITGSSDHGILELYDGNLPTTTITALGTSTIAGDLEVNGGDLTIDGGSGQADLVLISGASGSRIFLYGTGNAMSAGDNIGALYYQATENDGVTNQTAAYIIAEPTSNTYAVGSDQPTRLKLGVSLDNASVVTDVLFVDGSTTVGRVGILDQTPSYTLDVNGIIRGQSDVIVDGNLRLNNNIIEASDGGTAITLDSSSNVTITGDLTVSGGNIIGPSGTGVDLIIESSDDVYIQLDNDSNEAGFFGIRDGGSNTNFQIFEDGSVNQGNGGASSAFNTYVMGHTGVDGDNGLIIYNTSTAISANDLLGSIGFDANDGNDPSQNSEASVSISAYAIEPFGISDKGGYMSIATQWINTDDDTVARETMRISFDGVYIHDGTYDVGTAYGGEAEAKARLHVSQSFCGDFDSGQVPVALFRTSETGNNTNLMVLEYQSDTNLGTTNDFLVFRDGDSEVGKVNSNGSGGVSFTSSFTGFHASCIENNENAQIGMIVESTGNIWHQSSGSNIDTALPKVTLASVENSKKVYGVISSFENEFPGYYSRSPLSNSEIPVVVNSIGEGRLLVSNIAGNIENGDYIQSSNIAGYGKKQIDDILRSSTVAKCTENIDWDSVTDTIDHEGSTYKVYLAACTYHCG